MSFLLYISCFLYARVFDGYTFVVCRWVALLPRQGGGRTIESFNNDFFVWLSQQIPAIEDYPYAGIEFSREPEIPVPPGEDRGEIGKSPPILFFCLYM